MTPDIALNGFASPRLSRSRSHSMSSDRPSMNGYGNLLSPPSSTAPEPAFIAASAASQIVSNDHDSRSDTWFDQHGIEPSGETALVAPAALKLVNKFLDQLLFNFLSFSRSTSLASLRPAVGEVLKPKLAKDAISGADQELQEYLGGGEDEELLAFHNGSEPNGNWDLELVWKRTRLRCMVYSSLGDMEEEDEDFYTEQEQLDGPPGANNRFSNNPGVVSPAVAIFLTSILEFMGEQALIIAGQAAYQRLRAKVEKEERDGMSTPADIAERMVVEEADMERVALDRTLGRLWRGWKKRIRSPTVSISMSREFSRESLNSLVYASRSASIAPQEHDIEEDASTREVGLAEDEYAATIPLPMSNDDVREIEIPGLALQSDDEEDDRVQLPPRPKSMMVFTQTSPDLPAPNSSQPETSSVPRFLSPQSRKRSNSMPSLASVHYNSPSSKRAEPSEGSAEGLGITIDPVKSGVQDSGETPDQEGLVAGVIAGTAAIGATAVAGTTAATNGEAPRTELVYTDEPDSVVEFTEEPQIMTSSRVSIGGRISPDGKDTSRRSSSRSHSVHSLRVIDVTSPRTPSISRQGSVDGSDYIASGRVISLSRPASLHSPIIVDTSSSRGPSPIMRSQTASPIIRNGSAMSSRHGRNSAEEPISEVEEQDLNESDSAPMGSVPSDIVAAMSGPNQDLQPFISEPTSTSTDIAQESSAFILSAAPPPRSAARDQVRAAAEYRGTQSNTSSSSIPRTLGAENGAPVLTPLRETMEVAPEYLDESSRVPKHSTYSLSEQSTSKEISLELARAAARTPAMTSRNSPPRSMPKASESHPQTQKSLHASKSSSSSISLKGKPPRTSEDSNIPEKGKSFEELIQSDQTIQYTLTPQNMRKIEDPKSAISQNKVQEVPRPPTGRSRSGSGNTTGRSHSGSVTTTGHSHSGSVAKDTGLHLGSITKDTGLHSNPPLDTKASKPAPKPTAPPSTSSRLRPGAPQARDARVDRDSIGDFAEFIRSTGPPGSYNETSRKSPAINGHRGANGTPRQASGSVPRVSAVATLPRRAESSAGRSRLQARDAVVPNGDTSSDLIDFIRQGPPSTDDHRIPRTVAPFRTTMDSDQMVGAIGGKAVDASLPGPRHSQTSTNFSNDQSMQSKSSSITSQSALLNGSSKMNKPLPNHSENDFDEEDMMPKRKTRRVRDPYAIDFSDEEDEFEVVNSRKPKPIKEESLADFLRNVDPPPDNDPPALAPRSQKDIKKKASAPSLMSRFGRSNTSPGSPPKPQSSTSAESRSSRSGSGTPHMPAHIPINVKTPASNPPPRGNGNYSSQLDTARNPSTGRVAQKSYQPREATTYATTGTNDLANFLRSDPPSGMNGPPPLQSRGVPGKEESSGFSRMFGRRRKVAT